MRLGPFLGSIRVVFSGRFSIDTVVLCLRNVKAVMVNRDEGLFRPWNENENTSFILLKNLGGQSLHIPTPLLRIMSIKY